MAYFGPCAFLSSMCKFQHLHLQTDLTNLTCWIFINVFWNIVFGIFFFINVKHLSKCILEQNELKGPCHWGKIMRETSKYCNATLGILKLLKITMHFYNTPQYTESKTRSCESLENIWQFEAMSHFSPMAWGILNGILPHSKAKGDDRLNKLRWIFIGSLNKHFLWTKTFYTRMANIWPCVFDNLLISPRYIWWASGTQENCARHITTQNSSVSSNIEEPNWFK